MRPGGRVRPGAWTSPFSLRAACALSIEVVLLLSPSPLNPQSSLSLVPLPRGENGIGSRGGRPGGGGAPAGVRGAGGGGAGEAARRRGGARGGRLPRHRGGRRRPRLCSCATLPGGGREEHRLGDSPGPRRAVPALPRGLLPGTGQRGAPARGRAQVGGGRPGGRGAAIHLARGVLRDDVVEGVEGQGAPEALEGSGGGAARGRARGGRGREAAGGGRVPVGRGPAHRVPGHVPLQHGVPLRADAVNHQRSRTFPCYVVGLPCQMGHNKIR
mmetsp:Transcript_4065/g.12737  ORF Transcript_4065/g.12737 Transcript_4065/m.12737 type:complete len:271 (-) Transcript_4065:22-834(-)